jgi:hypothetical protein
MSRPEHLKKPGKYEGKEYADIYPRIISPRHYVLIGERKEDEPLGKRGGRTEVLGDKRLRKGYADVHSYQRRDGTQVKAHARRIKPVSKEEADKIMEKRGKRSVSMDRRQTSKELYDVESKDSGYWRENYRKSDLKSIDDKKS